MLRSMQNLGVILTVRGVKRLANQRWLTLRRYSGKSCAPKKANLSAVLYGKNDLKMEERPIAAPKQNEVLLKMGYVGICGTDIHLYKEGGFGSYVIKSPMVLGHESCGTVSELGPGVKGLKVGDKVAIEEGVPCRICDLCKEGKYNLCPDLAFTGIPPHHGNITQYRTHTADFCHKLPDTLPLEEGALVEPISIVVNGCRRAKITAGETVLVLGAGTIGLCAMIVAKAMGAKKILIVDLVEKRLQLACELGADYIYRIDGTEKIEELSKAITETLCENPHKSLDCYGSETTMQLAIQATRPGGTICCIGLAQNEMKLPFMDALVKELDIKGGWLHNNSYPASISLLSSGKYAFRKLITNCFKIEETKQALELVASQKGEPIKVLIQCNPPC